MEPMRTLIIAGFKREKLAFAGLGILMVLATFALSLTLCLFTDVMVREETALEEIGAGDVFGLDSPVSLDDAAIEEIVALPDVEDVMVTDGISASIAFEDAEGNAVSDSTLASEEFTAWGSGLQFHLLSDDRSSYVADPAPPADDEIYITPALHTLRGANIGDYAVVRVGSEELRYRVAGFFEDPQMGTPFMEANRYLLSQASYDELKQTSEAELACQANTPEQDMASMTFFSNDSDARPIREVNIYLTQDARERGMDGRDLARIIADETAWGARATSLFSKETLASMSLMVVDVLVAVLGVFALLLFLIALVICVHSVSSSIREDYRDWGILKACGIHPSMLRRTLVIQYLFVALLGTILGFLAGWLSEPALWPSLLEMTGVLVQHGQAPLLALGAILCLLTLLLLVVLWKAQGLNRITPLVALREGTGDVYFKPRTTCSITGHALEAALAWRAIVAKKRNYIGLTACAVLLSAFVAMVVGIGGAISTPEAIKHVFGMWSSDISITIEDDDLTYAEIEDALDARYPIERSWSEAATMVNVGGEVRTFLGLTDTDVLDDSSVAAGRKPKQSNEVLVGLGLAGAMDLAVGDELPISGQDGKEHLFLVSGILSGALNGGYGMIVTDEGLAALAGTDTSMFNESHQIALEDVEGASPDETVREAKAYLEELYGDAVSLDSTAIFDSAGSMLDFTRQLFTVMGYAMGVFAVLLACVAVALISRRMFSDERRDLGTYRAVGFRIRALRRSFAIRFFAVALIGALVGAACSFAGGGWLVGQLFSLFGVGVFTLALSPWGAAGIALGMACVFAAAAYVASRTIRKVDVRLLLDA